MRNTLFRLAIVFLFSASPLAYRAAGQAAEATPQDAQDGKKHVLLITGEDYHGHKWRTTTPVLKAQLEKDDRLSVTVCDDLATMKSLDLGRYDAVVMHFKNYDPNVPGRAAYDNLAKFVRDGGGLVLVHFACGAFQEFREEFADLAGRVWNPDMPAHDPRGNFLVELADTEHPITTGLESFEITDELYTSLDGTAPIRVLADAKSKIDGKRYAMAFVLDYGKGHVFHTPLGHDTTALGNAAVGKLLRRGTAWATGLPPSYDHRSREAGSAKPRPN